jgi:hypothetical protein
MANLSVFPDEIDSFIRKQDIFYSDIVLLNEYKALKLKTDRSSAENDRLNELANILKEKLFLPDDLNKLQDCIVNLETFFKNQTEDYILQKQQEFNAEIQKFSYKGQYDSTTTYQMWNVVTYNHETYVSKQNNNIGHIPVGDSTDSWWFKAASRGAQGLPGIGLVFVGEYNNAVTYQSGQAVSYQGDIYYCIQTTVGNLPTDTTYWTLFLAGVKPVIQNVSPSNPTLGMLWIDTSA